MKARKLEELPRLTSDYLDIIGTNEFDSLLVGRSHD